MARLGDVCTKAASNIVQKDLQGREGIYPVYGAGGFITNVDFYQREAPYIAVVKDGAGVGRVMKLPGQSSVIGTMQYILPGDLVNIDYLAFAMEHMGLGRYQTGATIPHIYFKDYRQEEFPLPGLERQAEIAAVLNRIVTLISLRKRQLEKLDALVNSRFVELFGDVIHNSKGWQVHIFSEIASSQLGKMLDAKQQTGENSYPYLANFNVQWFRFNLENLNTMNFDKGDRTKFEMCDGDLLVCEGGEIGRCAVWHNELQPCFYQKAVHRVRCNLQIILPDYLSWWFRYNCEHEGFAAIAGAKATIAHLTGVKLKQLKVAVPPLELQQKFACFVEQANKLKLTIRQSLDHLETLKKSLMQEYFAP